VLGAPSAEPQRARPRSTRTGSAPGRGGSTGRPDGAPSLVLRLDAMPPEPHRAPQSGERQLLAPAIVNRVGPSPVSGSERATHWRVSRVRRASAREREGAHRAVRVGRTREP